MSRWRCPSLPLLCAGAILLCQPARAAEPSNFKEGSYGRAQLKYVNGLPVMILEGTPEEIGEQQGALIGEPMEHLVSLAKPFLKVLGYNKGLKRLAAVGNSMVPQFPADYRVELEALVKKAAIDRDMIVVGNTFSDITKSGGCSTLIVEAERSMTGQPLFGRNLDYPTLNILHRYSLVVVVRPKDKHAFVSVGFPGLIGVLSGMNDAGLAVATLEVYSSKDKSPIFNHKGVPYALCYRRILEECTTVDEAVKLLRALPRTTMNNLALCDKKGGAVIEFTPDTLVVRRPEKGLCPCTNHFRTERLSTGIQCRRYDALVKSQNLAKIDHTALAKLLDAANQGPATLQTMIFEPATLKLHLAIGECPSSALPLKELELAPFFDRGNGR
jgi:hypothetical protein